MAASAFFKSFNERNNVFILIKVSGEFVPSTSKVITYEPEIFFFPDHFTITHFWLQ